MYVFSWDNGRPVAAHPVVWSPIRDALEECKRLALTGIVPTRLKEECATMSSKDMMSRKNCLAVLDSLDWMENVWYHERNNSTVKGQTVFKESPVGLFKYLRWIKDLNDCLIPPTSFKSLIDHRRDVNRAKAIFGDMVRTAQVLEDMHLDKGTTWSSPNISKARATFVSGETLQALKNAIFAHQDLLDTMEALYPGSTTRVWCGAGRSGTYSTHIRMHAEAKHEQKKKANAQ
jgi:hypothetical protein